MTTSVTATFVFTDLVDSTATAARLGPAAAEDLRQTHFKLLRGAVAASGGTEVKNLGDGLMVMYSSPSRAIAGAAGMQQAIEHHNRSAEEPLGVRIGISTGEATEEDGDYFGDPVVEAARLCAAAQGGQVLVADLVRLMLGRHATQTFVELGDLELKGLPEPVPTVEMLWEPVTAAGSVPLPGRLVGAASNALFGFFGRSSELEEIAEARKRAQASQRCQAVFVAGEAGMGKTSLVAQATRVAHEDGAIVLFGHSDEDLGVTYQPWIEIVCAVVAHCDPEVVGGLRSAQRGALARLVPDLGGDTDRVGDPDTERLLLLEGTVELLAALSAREPVMIVLDDLHWADTASLRVLRHLITSTTPTNLTIAVTYRDTDLGRGDALNQLLADLHREANVARIALRGLDDTDLVGLLAAAAGHDLDDDGVGLAHVLRRETEGNPFFTGEILRHLGESGGIVLNDEGRWVLTGELDELGLPSSVRDVVGRRVERLGDDALRILCLAAVIGREFDVTVLAELADADEDTILDQMDAAVAAALLVESDLPGRYRFTHALTQHSLYDELSPTRRQRAHRRIAETLERQGLREDAGTLGELAHHWVAATRPADLDKALGYVRRAGDAALASLAPDDAIRWYQQALELVAQRSAPDDRQRASLLAALGAAQRQAGHPQFRESLVQAATLAEQLDATDLLVEAAFGFAFGESQLGDEDLKRIASAALDRLGTAPTPERARLLAILAGAFSSAGEWETRRRLSLEGVDVARRSGSDATLVTTINTTLTALATPDRLASFHDDAGLACELADRIGDPMLQQRSRYLVVWDRYQHHDLAGADRALAQMAELVDRVGLLEPRWELELATVGRLLLAGRADEAEAANDRALEFGNAAGREDALGAYGGLLYAVRFHQGRLDEIADFFLDVARDNPSIAALRTTIPAMLCQMDRVDEARDRLAIEEANGFDIPFDITWTNCVHDLLDAAASTASADAARTLVESAAPYADQVAAPTATLVKSAVARPLARAATVLGDYEQAEEWFALAHDIHQRLQAPFWAAHGQLDHADLCITRRADGDLERARDLITAAATTAAEYGCDGLTRRADGLLAEI